MAIQSEVFLTSYGARAFTSTKHIATKQHMAVWLKRVIDSVWIQASVNSFELINNSAVLTEAPSQSIYSQIEIRVADEPDELGTSQSDITLVASIATQIEEIVIVVVPNIAEILLADDNATIATTKASEANTSATNALTSENNAEIAEANTIVQAGIATTKASEALASKNSAEVSATTATTQAGIAISAVVSSFNYASLSEQFSNIAASKANEASLSALNARNSEEVVLDYVAIYSTNLHNGEFVSSDSSSEDFGIIVGSVSPFSAESTATYRTDFAISTGSIDCGTLY